MSEEPLRPKDGGEFWPDALYVEQHRRRRRHGGYCRGQQRVPLALHGLDLLEKQLEPIEFTFDLRFEMRGQGTAIAGLKFFQPVAPIAAQRLVSADALTE